jgi:hypothetical protein
LTSSNRKSDTGLEPLPLPNVFDAFERTSVGDFVAFKAGTLAEKELVAILVEAYNGPAAMAAAREIKGADGGHDQAARRRDRRVVVALRVRDKEYLKTAEERQQWTLFVRARIAERAAAKAPKVHTVSLGDRGRVEHSPDGVQWVREGLKLDTVWTVIDSHFEVVERLTVDGETYYRVRQDRERLVRAPDLYRLLDDSGAILDHRNGRDALSAILRDETRDHVRAGHAALGVYADAYGRLTLCTDPVPLTDEQSEVLQDAGPNVGIVPTADDVRPHIEIAARFDPDEAYPVVGLSALGCFVQALRSRGILVPHVFHVSHRSGLGKSTVALAFTERLYGRRSVSADAVASEFRIAALLDGGLPLTLEEGEKLDHSRLSAALKDAAERERFSKRGTKELGLVVFLSRSLVVITGNRFPFTSGPTQVRFLAPAFNVAKYGERRTPEARQEFDANFARLRPVGFALARFVLTLYPTLGELTLAVEAARREFEKAAGAYPWHDSRRSQAWALVLLGIRAWSAFARSYGLDWPRPDLLEAAAFFSAVVQPVERSTFESEVFPVQRFRSWFEVWRARNRVTSQRTLVQGDSEHEETTYREEVRGEGRLFDNDAINVGERRVPGTWIAAGLLDAYNHEQAVEDRIESLNDLARQAADASGIPRELVLDLEGSARQHRFSLGLQVRAAFVPEVLEK